MRGAAPGLVVTWVTLSPRRTSAPALAAALSRTSCIGKHAFAADAIFEGFFTFDDEHPESVPGHGKRQRRTTEAAADYREIISTLGHGSLLRLTHSLVILPGAMTDPSDACSSVGRSPAASCVWESYWDCDGDGSEDFVGVGSGPGAAFAAGKAACHAGCPTPTMCRVLDTLCD